MESGGVEKKGGSESIDKEGMEADVAVHQEGSKLDVVAVRHRKGLGDPESSVGKCRKTVAAREVEHSWTVESKAQERRKGEGRKGKIAAGAAGNKTEWRKRRKVVLGGGRCR